MVEAERLPDADDQYLSDQQEGFHQTLTRPNAWLLVASDSGAVVGLVGGFPDQADASLQWLGYLAVAPDWRRRGIATALIHEAAALVISGTATSMILTVHIDNTAARSLYESLGFTATGATTKTPNAELLLTYARVVERPATE